jgi:hypothetical protein
MLAAGNFARHRTICDFREFHLEELSELFVRVVKRAREMGLVKLGRPAAAPAAGCRSRPRQGSRFATLALLLAQHARCANRLAAGAEEGVVAVRAAQARPQHARHSSRHRRPTHARGSQAASACPSAG